MVQLYAVDIRTLAPRFETLVKRVDKRRRERIAARGATVPGLQSLAAGLLLTLVADVDTLDRALVTLPDGKPYLPGYPAFNLSHAGDYAVLATAQHAVGVDIERRRVSDAQKLAQRFFHPEEAAIIANSIDKQNDFLTLWTLKESRLKAEGCGFMRAPETVCILPVGARGAMESPDKGYHFFRYDDFAPEYHVAACSLECDFAEDIERVTF